MKRMGRLGRLIDDILPEVIHEQEAKLSPCLWLMYDFNQDTG